MNLLTRLIEAALFSAARPLTVDELQAVSGEATPAGVRAALDELRELLDQHGHAVELKEMAGGFQLLTRPAYAEAIERAQLAQRPRRLSRAGLETLAIIAYRQPVGRAEIEEIRGVAADGVLRSLQERGLLEVAGRSEGPGRPLLYATTPLFLELLGLRDLSELPRADELNVLLRPLAGWDIGADHAAGEEAGVQE